MRAAGKVSTDHSPSSPLIPSARREVNPDGLSGYLDVSLDAATPHAYGMTYVKGVLK
jgi:hypothetical protein